MEKLMHSERFSEEKSAENLSSLDLPEPLRAVFFDEEHLYKLGADLANGESSVSIGFESFNFSSRNKKNAKEIFKVYKDLSSASAKGEAIIPAAQWLLDNYYVVEESLFQIRVSLRARSVRDFPLMNINKQKDVPRVSAVAWFYVNHTDNMVSAENFKAIVEGFQSVCPLQIRELWALPAFLRFVLLENLCQLAHYVFNIRKMGHEANALADCLLVHSDDEKTYETLLGWEAHAQDTTFATQLLHRLRDGSQKAGKALSWLEKELEAHGSDAEKVILKEHRKLSAHNISAENIIKGLKLIGDIDWKKWFESVSQIDKYFAERSDFSQLDFASRNEYRRSIEELSQGSALSEYKVAERVIEFCQKKINNHPEMKGNIGFALAGFWREEFENFIGYHPSLFLKGQRLLKRFGWFSIFFPTLIMVSVFLWISGSILYAGGLSFSAVFLLLAFLMPSAFESIFGCFRSIILSCVRPSCLVGYDYEKGIPKKARTLLVVPALITTYDDADCALKILERHYWSNRKGEIFFALLSDWGDSNVEISKQDQDILDYLHKKIAQLNQNYQNSQPRFYLLHRRRLFNLSEGCWMGWERKRGKLEELNQLLTGNTHTSFLTSDISLPKNIAYVMTVDWDNKLTQDSVLRLVGKIEHPMNAPVWDSSGNRVSGYSIIQPRIVSSLTEKTSLFQRFFCWNRGLDPYVFGASDFYQDLFREGSFVGKGLYHVASMMRALERKIPENSVLSHDLLEGSLAQTALAQDVEIIEDYPTQYCVDSARRHRWARGDWQLLPFIFKKNVPISGLSRWKMIDNLLSSCNPVFFLLALIGGAILCPLPVFGEWFSLLVLSQSVPCTFEVFNTLLLRDSTLTLKSRFTAPAKKLSLLIGMTGLKIIFLPYQAWMATDAILRTFYRLFVSHKKLLEWRTAAQVEKTFQNKFIAYFYEMYGAVIIAAISFFVFLFFSPYTNSFALFLCVLWFFSPAVAWYVSLPQGEDAVTLNAEGKQKLRCIARRTWRYFEDHVTEEHHFLPPDNLQEIPYPLVAARTSPTNIGVYILSAVAAHEFGWISTDEAVSRIEKTLKTLKKMQRYNGHFYNWIDTKTLKPLDPAYVSTVDSGNLASHLIALKGVCFSWKKSLLASQKYDRYGLLDVVIIFEDILLSWLNAKNDVQPFLDQKLKRSAQGVQKSISTIKSKLHKEKHLHNFEKHIKLIQEFSKNIHDAENTKTTSSLVEWATCLELTFHSYTEKCAITKDQKSEIAKRLKFIEACADTLVEEMDFSFLFNKERKLFSIGFREDSFQNDESCYDLMASEARTTSFIAVARGDIPYEHWSKLGRPIIETNFGCALLSWSGSMFEYLMPPLLMKEPKGGLLDKTSRTIIQKQIAYAKSQNMPWGISESTYNARDHKMNYQYMSFGVPGLGLKRGLSENNVIAPYATLLAAQFIPEESIKNIEALCELGAMGRYGFYDAVDFTPQRVPEGEDYAIVFNFYAHHQGMSIIALSNILLKGCMRDFFHTDPMIQAAEPFLQEKIPDYVSNVRIRNQEKEISIPAVEQKKLRNLRVIKDPLESNTSINIMSNGSWSTMLSATGSGYSKWKDIFVTRWWADSLEDTHGIFIFLRDCAADYFWSATSLPKILPEEEVEVRFQDNRSTFIKTMPGLRSELECIVAAEVDGEGRRITVFNESHKERCIEITSFSELALAPELSDCAHPAFSKMFIETKITSDPTVIYAWRRSRSGETKIHMAHFATDSMGYVQNMEAETDRNAFIGRCRTLKNPVAFDPDSSLKRGQGCVLDPIIALRHKLYIPAHEKKSLTFWTVVAHSEEELKKSVAHLGHPENFHRQNSLSWTHAQIQTRHCGLTLLDAAYAQKIAGYLMYPEPLLHIPKEHVSGTLGKQSELWPMSISGDFPIFVVRIADNADIEIVAEALRFQEYLRGRGIISDLVILNEQASSYAQDLQNSIEWHCENSCLRGKDSGPRQHIFALRKSLMSVHSWKVLLATARIVMHTRNGRIVDQIMRVEARIYKSLSSQSLKNAKKNLKKIKTNHIKEIQTLKNNDKKYDDLLFWNGIGGFRKDGKEYVVRLNNRETTPAPWINVISNGNFGFHVSAEGSSFTWSKNSRDFQITPWSNDPVSDRPGEAFYIYEKASGKVFSPFRAVTPDAEAQYECRHGQGYSIFKTVTPHLTVQATLCIDPIDSVKITQLKISNTTDSLIKLRVYAYTEWVLGNKRGRAGSTVLCAHDDKTGSIFAHNPYNIDFSERVAFFASNQSLSSFTTDRSEFLKKGNSVFNPDSVFQGESFSQNITQVKDSCAATVYDIEIKPYETQECLFVLGDSSSFEEARTLIKKHLHKSFAKRIEDNTKFWDGFLGKMQVTTPDDSFNFMMNRWLPYQNFSCRIRARSAFYQASGAFGFRDQLQDSLALIWQDANIARRQILNAAARQFLEGDVQHWWLPETGSGIRSLISDDVVWLAYAVAEYKAATGDKEILEEEIEFLQGSFLEKGQHASFFKPEMTQTRETLYEHCARALDLAIRRTGKNGLPLILGGDWNDGMNEVGMEGKGESVWLGWFLLSALKKFIPIAQEKKDRKRIKIWKEHFSALKYNIEEKFWDGQWYQRGCFDDGTALGTHQSDECKIDSIAQTWSVLSGEGNKQRSKTAMDSVCAHLIDDDLKIIKLFTPPFSGKGIIPGYIAHYPPGVRENGSQYTHAAAWVVAALAKLGRGNDAFRYFLYLNPIMHSHDKESIKRYCTEPYVVCGDVYASKNFPGKGGWSWYTGSAGWLYRVGLEYILGIKLRDHHIIINPVIPDDWSGFSAVFEWGQGKYSLIVERNKALKKAYTLVNGKEIDPVKGIPMSDGDTKIKMHIP